MVRSKHCSTDLSPVADYSGVVVEEFVVGSVDPAGVHFFPPLVDTVHEDGLRCIWRAGVPGRVKVLSSVANTVGAVCVRALVRPRLRRSCQSRVPHLKYFK